MLSGVYRPLTANLRLFVQLWQLHKEKRELRKSHLEHWKRTSGRTGTGRPVDAIISPTIAYTAAPHGLNTSLALLIL